MQELEKSGYVPGLKLSVKSIEDVKFIKEKKW